MENLDHDAVATLELAAARLAMSVQECDAAARFAPAHADDVRRIRTEVPLSPELAHWYEYLAPETTAWVRQLGNDRRLYAFTDLVESQTGYRWRGVAGGRRGEQIANWPASWLVIGDDGSDPLIAETAAPGTPVSFGLHGMGRWQPHLLAPTLTSYLEAQARWIQVCLIQTGATSTRDWAAGSRFIWEESGQYRPAVSLALQSALAGLLPDECLKWWL